MGLTTLPNARIGISVQAQATKAVSGLPTAVVGAANINNQQSYALGAGAAACNEVINIVATIVNGTPLNIDLSAVANDICAQTSINLARLKGLSIKVIPAGSYASDGTTAGTSATSITVGAAASNPFTGLLNSTGTLTLKNGAQFAVSDPTAAGMVVSTGVNLKIANNDSGASAVVEITIFGADS